MVDYFICPKCGGNLELFEDNIRCISCFQKYKVIDDIIDFTEDNENQEVSQTIDAFGWQWNNTETGHTKGSIEYSHDLFFARYNLSKSELGDLLKDKIILDPAVGSGRVEHIFGKYPKLIFANDMSSAIYAAKKKLNRFGFNNIKYSKSDMQNLPFPDLFFDAVVCHATLQHVENPLLALKSFYQKLKPGGIIMFDLYKKAAPVRDFCDDFIRSKISDLSPEEAYNRLLPLSRFGEYLSSLDIKINIPENIDMLEIEAGEYSLQRLFYYKFLKMFWNEGMSFEENHIVNFDWYYPKISPRFTRDEVGEMLNSLDVEIIDEKITEGGMGFIIRKR